MKHYKITEQDYVKGMRKASRELEIELHGKQCSLRTVPYRDKSKYSRKNYKIEY